MSKSFVAIEQKACVVCCAVYDTGSMILDTSLEDKLNQHEVTGVGACEKCQKLADDDYIALVVAKGKAADITNLDVHEANRTGEVIHIRRVGIFSKIFDIPPPPEDTFPMLFIDGELSELLKLFIDGELSELLKGIMNNDQTL